MHAETTYQLDRQTCTSVHILSQQRSFWISILETTRKESTIGCPRYADLSQYGLESLKDLVFSWLKLQSNWNRPFPRIIHPVTSTVLSEPADIVLLVQGTDIVLLHMKSTGVLVCWDVKTATPFPFPSINIGAYIYGVSAPFESYDTCSVALLTSETIIPHASRRHVVTMRHKNRKAISFDSVAFEVSTPINPHFESLFLTEDMVGSVTVEDFQEDYTIATSNITGSEPCQHSVSSLKLHRPVTGDYDLMIAFTYKGHLYNLLEDGVSIQTQHISRKSLSSGHCEESGSYKSGILELGENADPFCYIAPSTPYYGVAAAFARIVNANTPDSTVAFTFLPNALTDVPDDGVSSPLAFNSHGLTQCIPGKLLSMALVWMDHGGFNIAVVVESVQGDAALILVRYHPETASTSSHKLIVPDSIDLFTLRSVCIDDTAGAVYLVDQFGVFWILRYV
ncbi:hypothetical protein B0H11DRAFT_620339 [Mycena galericulata]|nr:hypothetical protein B0H11DRAFT_620339 [Mycena galericulata]